MRLMCAAIPRYLIFVPVPLSMTSFDPLLPAELNGEAGGCCFG
jgi:hypothetical protein